MVGGPESSGSTLGNLLSIVPAALTSRHVSFHITQDTDHALAYAMWNKPLKPFCFFEAGRTESRMTLIISVYLGRLRFRTLDDELALPGRCQFQARNPGTGFSLTWSRTGSSKTKEIRKVV